MTAPALVPSRPAPASRLIRWIASGNPNQLERLYVLRALASNALPAWATASDGRWSLATDLPVFAQHAPRPEYLEPKLRHLADNGYATASLEEFEAWSRGRWTPKRPTVLLTFDDGLRDFGRRVVPLLEQYRFTAVLFVCPGIVELASRMEGALGALAQRQYLDWTELSALVQRGTVDIASHGMWHSRVWVSSEATAWLDAPPRAITSMLDLLPPGPPVHALMSGTPTRVPRYTTIPLYMSDAYDDIFEDARTARTLIAERLSRTTTAFAFPWWNGSSTAQRALRDAGYDSLFWGMRMPVKGVPGATTRVGRLGFDWIHCLPGAGRITAARLLGQKLRRAQED